MKLKYVSLLLCLSLLSACGKSKKTEIITNSTIENTQQRIEETSDFTQYTTEETTETTTTLETITKTTTEYTEEIILPHDIDVPKNAAYCQILHIKDGDSDFIFYDNHNNEILYINGSSGKTIYSREYEYNSDGTVAVMIQNDTFWESIYTYTYNENEEIKQCFHTVDGHDEGYYNEYEYDDHGQILKDHYIDTFDNTTMFTVFFNNEYDNEGRLIQQTDDIITIQYVYDENGNIIHEIHKLINSNESLEEYIYTYDENGNKLTGEYISDGITVYSDYSYIYY